MKIYKGFEDMDRQIGINIPLNNSLFKIIYRLEELYG